MVRIDPTTVNTPPPPGSREIPRFYWPDTDRISYYLPVKQDINDMQRDYTVTDHLIMQVDHFISSFLSGRRTESGRVADSPANSLPEPVLGESERRLSEGLMRVNHVGEVSAQALYQGQAITCRDQYIRSVMHRSAIEERDHLAWCKQRLTELNGHTSYLNPFWYIGSFSIGTLAGLAGDKWSLGFVAETERQVVEHLTGHLQRLPLNDSKSRVVVQQMIEDESRHGTTAMAVGGVELPWIVKKLMRFCSRIMTRTAYWI
jgi:3-demethoxyubiquinol 3-hydroxylase